MEKKTELIVALIVAGVLLVAGYFVYKKYLPEVESVLPTPAPWVTCKPRPKCLDENPRCLIPETSDMCPPAPKACTLEAKLCPDGSSVGRVGPDCEFAPCPNP